MNKNLYQKVFSVLADGNRLGILNALREKEKSVTEVYKELGMGQSLVSHHLKVLRDFGFVKSRIMGKKRLYFVNKDAVDPLLSWAEQHAKKFSKVLAQYDVEGWVKMDPIEAIDHETEIIMNKIQVLRKSVTRKGPLPKKRLFDLLEFFNKDMETHFRVEELTLFPVMKKKGKADLVSSLLLEHKILRNRFAELEKIVQSPEGKRDQLIIVCEEIVEILKVHVQKEDAILLPYAERVLTKRELNQLKREGEKIEKGIEG